MRRPTAVVAAIAAAASLATLAGTGPSAGADPVRLAATPVPAAPAPAAADDVEYGGVRNLLPPGSNGTTTAADLLALGGSRTATPTTPTNFADQLEIYDALTTHDPATLTGGDVDGLFKDSGFTPQEVVSTTTPRDGVTIRRDGFGVPFVTGETFADVQFGAGYATVEDRMFLMDVLRHTGAARITEFVGDTPGNVRMDTEQLRSAFYTRAEAAAQVEIAARRADAVGADGDRLLTAVDSYLEGVNAAQDALCPVLAAPTCPGEYAALQKTPRDWDRADIVYVASLVGGIFGKGGGGELANVAWLRALTERFGEDRGRRIYDDLRAKNDPEAPTTSTISRPYLTGGIDPDRPGVALPDADAPIAPGTGSLVSGARSGARAAGAVTAEVGRIDLPDGTQLSIPLHSHGMSNAVLVGADRTTTGRPIAVMGPQTGYFTPQLLVEQVLDGPGIKARGVAFAGTNLFVQLGRGVDYAWSATSASSDNVDIVVERLCNTDGTRPTLRSTGYRVGRACRPMERFTHTIRTTPGATSPAPPRTLEFLVLRTRHGLVQHRTRVEGRPVAVVRQRSTYGHEVDSVAGFSQLNDPGFVDDAASFQRAVSNIDFTFNWFYADDRDISFYSSGLLPLRSPDVEPDLPRWGDPEYDWRGWLPVGRHPHETNPPTGYFVSWNNKPAPGFGAADNNWSYGPIYRSLALEKRLRTALAGGRDVDVPDVVGVASGGATADARAEATLPVLLAVMGDDPATSSARALLTAWLRDGAQRVDRDRDGDYEHQAAVAIFDDWWQRGETSVARAVLRPRLRTLADELPQKLDDHPRLGIGSAYNGIAWYGYVSKDLRSVLGLRVRAPYRTSYCGRGSLELCRAVVRRSLQGTLEQLLERQEVTDPADLTYDKTQDQIRSVTAGLVGVRPIDWQNRPTFHLVVDFEGHRPR